jgi:hypothetical protein
MLLHVTFSVITDFDKFDVTVCHTAAAVEVESALKPAGLAGSVPAHGTAGDCLMQPGQVHSYAPQLFPYAFVIPFLAACLQHHTHSWLS